MSIPALESSYNNFLAVSAVLPQMDLYETRVENNPSGQALYIGKCITPNAPTDLKIWYIKKFYYDGNGFVERIQLPDDGAFFMYAWDDRATYFS